jgi:hypothetical protein
MFDRLLRRFCWVCQRVKVRWGASVDHDFRLGNLAENASTRLYRNVRSHNGTGFQRDMKRRFRALPGPSAIELFAVKNRAMIKIKPLIEGENQNA